MIELELVEKFEEKQIAQMAMERTLKSKLESKGKRKIGFRGGYVEAAVFSAEDGGLWCAFVEATENTIQRWWNSFGKFREEEGMQGIVLEINVPMHENSGRVRGVFARLPETGKTWLLHDGGVGGGKSGVGKDSFMRFKGKSGLARVVDSKGKARLAYMVGEVGCSDLPENIWNYTESVRRFKDLVDQGGLPRLLKQSADQDWEAYRKEATGTRKGRVVSMRDYVTHHGNVVDLLFREFVAAEGVGTIVSNDTFVDLRVRVQNGATRFYEVKTSLDRQAIYTGIGQLMVHPLKENGRVERILVLPKGPLPGDLESCISQLGISLRRFRMLRNGPVLV